MTKKQQSFDGHTGEEIPVYIGWYQPHLAVDLDFKGEESLTKQSFKDECDVNNIVKAFTLTQNMELLNKRQGMFIDLPDSLDFQESLNQVVQGEAAFAALPSAIRDRFGNNPRNFLDFMSDPANQEEAIKLGLATDNRPPPKEAQMVPADPIGGEGGKPPSEGAKAP